jgi:hypothetical protein
MVQLRNKKHCVTKQRGICDNEGISLPSKVGTAAPDKELGDNSSAKYLLHVLSEMKIMGAKLNTVLCAA